MATITRMGRLTNHHKLTVRTSADVVESVSLLAVRYQRAGLKFQGRVVSIEGLVGAVLMDFLAKSPDEQRAIVERWLPGLEAAIAQAPPPDGDFSHGGPSPGGRPRRKGAG